MVEKVDPNSEQQFDLNLIEAVKANPVIYDRSHYNYKHFVRKAQVWKQISDQLGMPEQKCTKRWKSLRDKFAREMKLSTESRWRYFKQMSFLVESIRQYRESLLGKCGPLPTTQTATTTTQVNQVDANQSQQQQQQQQHTVVDIFPFNGAAATSAQTIHHPHVNITVTGDSQITTTATSVAPPKETKTFYYEPPLKRERLDDDQQQQQQQQQQQTQQQQQQQQQLQLQQNNDNMLNTIKIFQNSLSQSVNPEDQSFGVVVTDMLNTLGVRQKADAKVHIIKYLTDMQLLAQHNKY